MTSPSNRCLFCGEVIGPDHFQVCDGKQGAVEASLPFTHPAAAPRFDGAGYDPALDHERLGTQALRVWAVMIDARWRTLGEIERATGDPQASISAQLRTYRKARFGSHTIERRRRGEAGKGLYEYRLIPTTEETRATW
jgi:hypothetical protein